MKDDWRWAMAGECGKGCMKGRFILGLALLLSGGSLRADGLPPGQLEAQQQALCALLAKASTNGRAAQRAGVAA